MPSLLAGLTGNHRRPTNMRGLSAIGYTAIIFVLSPDSTASI